MGRSRARLAADWFAKLRQNATTGIVEHTDVSDITSSAEQVFGPWVITEVSGELHFKSNGVVVFKINASGAITSVDNVTAYGSV